MRIPQWFVMVWVIGIALVSVAGSALAYTFVRDRAGELDSVLELPDLPQLDGLVVLRDNTATPAPTATTTPLDQATPSGEGDQPGNDTQPAETPDPAASEAGTSTEAQDDIPAWNDPRRVSILLLGIDQREGEQGTFPTDTVMLLSLDPVGKTAAMLTIPRDLWVEYPGLNISARVNGANIVGDDISYPGGGGPAYAVQTVENVLGINIQYYVLINFEVFYNVIDAVGPIEVCPESVIHDDEYPDGSYGYMTVHFEPGCQELDSEHLLQYARTRHGDAESDIGRSKRQQEVILKVREKILSTGGVTALLPEAPGLWESMQANIKTNLSFEEIISLARSAEKVGEENIRQSQISFDEVYMSTSDDGDQILVPIGTDIRMLIEDLFRPAGTPSTRGS